MLPEVTPIIIRKATTDDTEAVLSLYKKVAANSGGIARGEEEITKEFITNAFKKVEQNGLMLVAINDISYEIVGVIHASGYGIQIFQHVLTDLTILVHPRHQANGIGKQLFTHFLQKVQTDHPHIGRIELESRASNLNSIGLYTSLGFIEEGRMKNKTRNGNGSFEDSILFAWTNPDYKF